MKTLNEVLSIMGKAEQNALNSEAGQEITTKLLEMKLASNPNMTVEEWESTKKEFMIYLFNEVVKNNAELMNILAKATYNELRA